MPSRLVLLPLAASLLVARPSFAEPDAPRSKREPLDIDMFYQYSATDDDAEVTIDVESPDHPVGILLIVAPDGRPVSVVRSGDDIGLAAIEVESAEPSVEEVQRAYPEGTYWFWGTSVDGASLFGRVKLTHDVIGAPDFGNFSPCGRVVDPTSIVTIAWNSVAGADGGYEIIIEQDDTDANLRVTQRPDRNSFSLPDGFLEPGLEYEIEMKAVIAGGNKTSASCEFSTQ